MEVRVVSLSKFHVFALVALFAICPTPPCPAADDILIDGVESTFPGSVVQGQWNVRTVSVTNLTSAPRQVNVLFNASSPSLGAAEFARPITLNPRTTRRESLWIKPHNLPVTSELNGRKIALEAFELFDLTSPGRAASLQTTSILTDDQPLLVSFTGMFNDEPNHINYLFNSDPDLKINTLVGPFVSLPDRWAGYSGVHIVVLGGMDMAAIRASQRQALLDWVGRGGVLVLCGSTSLQDTLTGTLGHAAGVIAGDTHSVSSLEVSNIGYTAPVPLMQPSPMVQLCPQEATVLAQANGLPLLTRNPWGQGYVFTLAVACGVLDAKVEEGKGDIYPLHGVWSLIYPAVRTLPAIRNDSSFMRPHANRTAASPSAPAATAIPAKTASQVLQQIAGRRGPVRTVPTTILIALAGLSLAGGLALRFKRRGELLWLALVPLAAAIGIGMYIQSQRQVNPERLTYIGLLTSAGDGRANVQQAVAYYSGPDDRKITFAAPAPEAVIDPVQSAGASAMGRTRFVSDTVLSMPLLPVAKNSTREFHLQAVVPTRGITGQLTFGPSGLTGQLTNELGQPITDALVYMNDHGYRVGNIQGRAAVSVSDAQLLGRNDFTGNSVKSDVDQLRNDLLRQIAARGPKVAQPSPLLIGYTNQMPLSVMAGRAMPPQQGWSVVAWPIPLVAPPAAQRVLIPSGFVERTVNGIVPDGDGFVKGNGASQVIVMLRPPAVIPSLTSPQATLQISVRAMNSRLTVSGVQDYSPDSRTPHHPLKAIDNPSGAIEIKVPDAGRFYSKQYGYVFALTLEPAAADASDNMGQWQYESIEASLEGITP